MVTQQEGAGGGKGGGGVKAHLVGLAMDSCHLEVGDARAGRPVLDPEESLDVQVQLVPQLLVLYHPLDVQAREYLCRTRNTILSLEI